MMVGASIFHFASGMAARDFFSWRDLPGSPPPAASAGPRRERTSDMHSSRDSALAFVAGKKVAEIVALGEEIYDEEMADRIWPGTRALARRTSTPASGSGW